MAACLLFIVRLRSLLYLTQRYYATTVAKNDSGICDKAEKISFVCSERKLKKSV